MILSNNWKIFAKFCRFVEFSGIVAFRWDAKKKEMKTIQDEKYLRNLKVKCYIHTFLTIGIFIQFILSYLGRHSENGKSESSVMIIPEMFAKVGHYAIANTLLHAYRNHAGELSLFFNGLVQFNSEDEVTSEHPPPKYELATIERYGVYFIRMAYGRTWVLGAVAIMAWWKSPCKPNLVGYWLIPECMDDKKDTPLIAAFAIKLMVIIVNAWLIYVTSFMLGFLDAPISVLGIGSLRGLIQSFLKDFLKKCDYTTATKYRRLQVLCILINSIQKITLGITVIGAVAVVASCTTVIVKVTWGLDSIPRVLSQVGLLMGATPYIMICMGGMAEIYTQSVICQEEIRKKRTTSPYSKGTKWQKLFFKSCSPIKIKLGSINYVDQLTPLNCIEFAIDLAVNLLLLGG